MKTAVVNAALNTVTGNQDITLPGLGWTPKAVEVIVTDTATPDVDSVHARFSIGYWDGSLVWSCGAGHQDGVATTNTRRFSSLTYLGRVMTGSGSILAGFEPVAFIPDGIRINVTAAPATGYRIQVRLFGGDDFQAKVWIDQFGSTAKNQECGFAAKATFVATIAATAYETVTTSAALSFGFGVVGAGQACIAQTDRDGQATVNSAGAVMDGRVCQFISNTPALSWGATISAYANGVRVTPTAGTSSSYIGGMAFTCTGNVWAGTVTLPGGTGSDWSVSDPGWRPQYVNLIASAGDATGLKTGATEAFAFSNGASDGTREGSIGWRSADDQPDGETASYSSGGVIWNNTPLGVAQYRMSGLGFSSTGFHIPSTGIATASPPGGIGRVGIAFAIESESGGAGPDYPAKKKKLAAAVHYPGGVL